MGGDPSPELVLCAGGDVVLAPPRAWIDDDDGGVLGRDPEPDMFLFLDCQWYSRE